MDTLIVNFENKLPSPIIVRLNVEKTNKPTLGDTSGGCFWRRVTLLRNQHIITQIVSFWTQFKVKAFSKEKNFVSDMTKDYVHIGGVLRTQSNMWVGVFWKNS